MLPISGVEYVSDELGLDEDYNSDFADCFQLAWHAIIEKEAPEHDRKMLQAVASVFIAQAGTVPVRKVLANAIRSMLLDALEKKPDIPGEFRSGRGIGCDWTVSVRNRAVFG